MSDLAVNDALSYKDASPRHVIHHNMADEVAEWIIGDPARRHRISRSLLRYSEKKPKRQFKIRLLGIY